MVVTIDTLRALFHAQQESESKFGAAQWRQYGARAKRGKRTANLPRLNLTGANLITSKSLGTAWTHSIGIYHCTLFHQMCIHSQIRYVQGAKADPASSVALSFLACVGR